MFPQYQFGGFQPNMQTPVPAAPTGPVVRPVTSREEAAVAQIPFDGSAAYFINTANGEIYAKAFRQDGTAPLAIYRRVEDAPVQYATVEQLNAIMEEIEKLKKPKGGKQDEK